MTDYLAKIKGTWNPGSIPAIEPAGYGNAQRAAAAATRSALGLPGDTLAFHLIGTTGPDSPVYRQHWKLFAYVGGPALRMGTPAEHDSEISLLLRAYPLTEVQHVTFDPDLPWDMPYGAVMAGVVPALLLRHRFGTGPRQLTIGSLGTGTFTPTVLSYPDLYAAVELVEVPYDTQGLASYGFTLPAYSSSHSAMWLVTDDGTWKVSYCAERVEQSYAQRWDDPDEPAPAFEPLPAPDPVMPEVSW